MPCLARFDRWLSVAFNDPRDVLADPTGAAAHAAAFRRWDSDPLNRRSQRQGMDWEKFARLRQRYPLPAVRVVRLPAVT
jgi:hypothetical protein